MFERVSVAPADPILGLTDAYKADPRPQKINLGVGVFKDEQGNTPILDCVKEAERRLVNSETTKGYLAINGSPEYGQAVQQLLLGKHSVAMTEQRVVTAQAPGGTGALRVGAEFIVRHLGIKTIWVSDPTWANHNTIFQAAGLTVKTYAYFDA
ncbi:MAG: aminotransferase class I/II-fold pyridoxal phosphate-dependent enzyme, partial [Natronospirillum sp.]